MGKTGRKNKIYSAELKIGVIMDMREHHLGYREIVRKYKMVNNSYRGAVNTLKGGNAYTWKREPKA